MNVYFETSALIKVFLEEQGAEEARDLWDQADLITVTLIAYPEAGSALAAANRAGRISTVELGQVKRKLGRLWTQTQIVDFDQPIALSAGDVAEQYGLRGYDAVHLATAMSLQDESLVVATWDADLRKGAVDAGLRVAPASYTDSGGFQD